MKRLFKSKTFWIIIVIVAIAIGVLIRIKLKREVEYVTAKVSRGDIIQSVFATGQVKAASEIDLNFKITGRIVRLNAKVGDQVKAGQILAQLYGQDLAINVTKAAANLAAAEADLAKLLAGATTEDIATLEAKVAQEETDLKNAQQDLTNTELIYSQDLVNKKQAALSDINTALTKSDIALQTINDTLNFKNNPDYLVITDLVRKERAVSSYEMAKLKVAEAKNYYNLASAELNDDNINNALVNTLLTLNFVSTALDDMADGLDYALTTNNVSQTELDTLKSNINTQRTTIDSSYDIVQTAQQDVKDAQVTYQTKVDDAKQTVESAEKDLAKARADLTFKKAAPRPEDISWYQAKVKQARADLAYTQSKYNETILKAPVAGIITAKNKNLGEQSELTVPVFSMLSSGNYEIEVDIPESDIVKIQLNDKADITLDALTEDDVFEGIITKIDPAETEIQDVVYYKVTVTYATKQPANVANLMPVIKPGMTANVTVKTDQRTDVLMIPQKAVKEVEGQKIVSVLVNGQPQERAVAVGLRGDEGMVEVISGLKEGEEVVTFVKKK